MTDLGPEAIQTTAQLAAYDRRRDGSLLVRDARVRASAIRDCRQEIEQATSLSGARSGIERLEAVARQRIEECLERRAVDD